MNLVCRLRGHRWKGHGQIDRVCLRCRKVESFLEWFMDQPRIVGEMAVTNGDDGGTTPAAVTHIALAPQFHRYCGDCKYGFQAETQQHADEMWEHHAITCHPNYAAKHQPSRPHPDRI